MKENSEPKISGLAPLKPEELIAQNTKLMREKMEAENRKFEKGLDTVIESLGKEKDKGEENEK